MFCDGGGGGGGCGDGGGTHGGSGDDGSGGGRVISLTETSFFTFIEKVSGRQTCGWMDGPKDKPSPRDARTQLTRP